MNSVLVAPNSMLFPFSHKKKKKEKAELPPHLYNFMYLFLAMLGLHCFVCVFSICGEQGYSLLLYMGFSLWWLLCGRAQALEHGLGSCGTWA